jgi:ribosome-binding factor A
MVEPLRAAVIVSLFFSEAIKEGGKALGKGDADTFTLLINTIREKFRVEGTEGLLKRAENDPTLPNKAKLQDELQTQMDADEAFAQKLKELVQQLQVQDEKIRQVVLSEVELTGDLKAEDISKKAKGVGSVEQEMVESVKDVALSLRSVPFLQIYLLMWAIKSRSYSLRNYIFDKVIDCSNSPSLNNLSHNKTIEIGPVKIGIQVDHVTFMIGIAGLLGTLLVVFMLFFFK